MNINGGKKGKTRVNLKIFLFCLIFKMKIEVNNVYQKKSISKLKVGIVIAFFIILLIIIFWRLYYERAQTTGVSSFAEFIGISSIFAEDTPPSIQPDNNPINIIEDNNTIEEEVYIPAFTEQSLYNVEKIYNLSEDGQKRVYLTFDDGPSRDVTPLVLDVLKKENVYATFFVLGNKVEQNPDILKRIYEEGHYIGNHGYGHVYSKLYANADAVINEYNKCEEAIQNVLEIPEYSTHLFRFPGGSSGGPYNYIKRECSKRFKENNVGVLDWNCLTKDSEGNYTKEQLIENFKKTSYRKK